MGELQRPHQELGHGGGTVVPGQICGFRGGDQTMVNQRQPIPDAFEALPHRHLLLS